MRNVTIWEELKEAPSYAPSASPGLFASFAEQLSIAVFGHPARAGKMAVVNPSRPLVIGLRTDSEDHGDGFPPIGAVGRCVENAHINLHMLTVIICEHRALRRFVQKS